MGLATGTVLPDRSRAVPKSDEFTDLHRTNGVGQRPKSAYITTTATKVSTGAAIMLLRRTSRSCAAPFACHAAHRCSKLADSADAVDIVVGVDATTAAPSMAMDPHARGFGEGSTMVA